MARIVLFVHGHQNVLGISGNHGGWLQVPSLYLLGDHCRRRLHSSTTPRQDDKLFEDHSGASGATWMVLEPFGFPFKASVISWFIDFIQLIHHSSPVLFLAWWICHSYCCIHMRYRPREALSHFWGNLSAPTNTHTGESRCSLSLPFKIPAIRIWT